MRLWHSTGIVPCPIARRVAELYRQRALDVWIDEGAMSAGDSLTGRLSAVIDRVDMFVLIMTAAAAQSDWVNYELEVALHQMVVKRKSVVAIRFDDSPLP